MNTEQVDSVANMAEGVEASGTETMPRPVSQKPAASRLSIHGARLLQHVRIPLYNNAYALIVSGISTSGLGIVYWAVAARFYTARDIGLNSAAISGMMLFSGISQLNLIEALIRFLPRAGEATARLVRTIYAASFSVSVVLGLSLFLLRNVWSPIPELFNGNTSFLLWFIVATGAWSIFALQDFVLTGLRQAKWVPPENILFAVIKIVLVVALASQFQKDGIFLSWTFPTLLAIVAINGLLFFRLIPRHVAATRDRAETIVPRQFANYVAGNYVGYLFFLASTTLLPIIVKVEDGSQATAYFYLAWIFAYSLYLIAQNMTASLIVESSLDQDQLGAYSYRVLMQLARLVVPLVVIFLVGAPFILDIFGSQYSAQGTDLLRLLALATIPNIVNALYIGIARVRRRMASIVLVQGALCIISLGLTPVLLHVYGIAGVGLAWLISQSVVAVFLMFTELRTSLFASRRSLAAKAE
jgi:O-antigen/teichoic acid export membrane protein